MGERQTVGLDGSRCALLVPFVLLALSLVPVSGATAQETAAACSPAIGRIVSIQGNVEIQRSGQKEWVAVKRLDTTLCAEDRLRTDAESRAGVFLQPETMVRVDQNTVIRLKQADDEIEVQFFGAELADNLRNAQPSGGGYFITRFPKKFKVTTPHMNAAVEGTEFMVQITPDATKLTVLEGKVSSQSVATGSTQLVEAGQSVSSGAAGPSTIETVVKPQDAVQWVLRYPPISDQSDTSGISRAEQLLRAGSVEEALSAIDAELAANPSSGDAHALRSVIEVAKNDKSGALESARKATKVASANYRAWLALSYVQQAEFDLEAALESARKAEMLRPDSALAHARVAELLLSTGHANAAEEAARAAVASNPGESYAHAMLGFVHLAKIDIKAARLDFVAASGRDSFSALPRLGLGLALIRDGDLKAGRESLEVAVALDPSNSLLRSYIGKAYYEENSRERDQLADTQFELAQRLDPEDPTPWLYRAILKESLNRPLEALADLQASAMRNDNRAVYRSRLLLDDDAAARNSSVAAVYRTLGFEKLAIAESAKALADSPGNFSAHRQLATAYSDLPRHDISRVSEALQAQIRQPVSLAAVGPQLGTDNLAINRNVGPARPSTNEFNAMFNRDDLRVQVDGIVGGLDTLGDEFVATALLDNVSYSIGQLHYETDGFTDNDAARRDIYDFLVHGQIAEGSTVQLEAKRSEFEVGETFFSFDEFQFPTTLTEDIDTLRLSGHHVFQVRNDIVWSAIVADRFRSVRSFPDGGLFQSSDAKPASLEIQYVGQVGRIELIAGAGYIDDTSHFGPEQADERNTSGSVYGYVNWHPSKINASIQLGVAAEELKSKTSSEFGTQIVDKSQLSPKIGVIWSLLEGTTIRAAAVSSLHRPFISSQTIEPTQIAGFNQFFDGFEQFYGDFIGTDSDRVGVALEQVLSPTAFGGLEWSARRLDVPSFVFVGQDFEWRENEAHAYWYKTLVPIQPVSRWSEWQTALSAEIEYENVDRPQVLTGAEGIMNLDTIRAPLGIQLFNDRGLTLRLATTYVDQQGDFSIDVGLPIVHTDDQAWITDASIEYRLPRRKGLIAIGAMNLFDESIELLEIDPVNPRVATKRFVFARFSLTFQ